MKLQLQSILLPDKNICNLEELYLHRNDDGEVRFDGYFNLFYIEKRKAYTWIDNLSLQLTLRGFDKLTLMHDETVIEKIPLDPEKSCENTDYIIELPYKDYDSGVFWFSLTKQETITEHGDKEKPVPEEYISGFFVTELPEDKIRPINIAVDICTYKREECLLYVLKQIEKVIKDQALDASSHLSIFVIDNGKTLQDCAELMQLEEDSITDLKVYLNKNVGGAGGFTRGMLEILNDKGKKRFTHVLLMDDDVTLEPDAFVRIYGFLTTLGDEWKNMTIGGAMLREDPPYLLYCAGEYWKSAYSYNPCKDIDLRSFKNATEPLLTEIGHEHEWYSGWWLCCYSLNAVRGDNLPLPLFIHHDDIEYGLRNRSQGIVFLNGICVWHKAPDEADAGVNTYYDIRNSLIEISLNEKESRRERTAAWVLFKSITHSAMTRHYANARLAYQGFIDFLKGPDWLAGQDPEKTDKKIRKEYSEERDGMISIFRKTVALFIRYFKPASENWNKGAVKLENRAFWEEYLENFTSF